MTERKTPDKRDAITETVTLRYDYALGEVAGRFMAGLKEGKILATRCSKSTSVPLLLFTFDVNDVITPAVWSPGDASAGIDKAMGTIFVARGPSVIVDCRPVRGVIQADASAR